MKELRVVAPGGPVDDVPAPVSQRFVHPRLANNIWNGGRADRNHGTDGFNKYNRCSFSWTSAVLEMSGTLHLSELPCAVRHAQCVFSLRALKATDTIRGCVLSLERLSESRLKKLLLFQGNLQ